MPDASDRTLLLCQCRASKLVAKGLQFGVNRPSRFVFLLSKCQIVLTTVSEPELPCCHRVEVRAVTECSRKPQIEVAERH